MLWALGAIVVMALVGGIYLFMTLSTNGPYALSAVDRIAGGARGATELVEVSTGDHPAQKLHVWGPESAAAEEEARPVLIFVHGGGWRSGDPGGYGYFGRSFVPEGFVVVLAGYRLGEDGIYPGMLEDTASAIAWTHANIADHGGDPNRIVLAGHSAGAYNVVQIALEDRWLGAHGLSPADISGVIGMAGPYDFAPFDSDSTIAAFGHVEDGASTQPVNFVRADAPPMLLINGEKDTLVGARNARLLAELLNKAGANAIPMVIPDMTHNDPILYLAAPWRDRADYSKFVFDFAKAVTSGVYDRKASNEEASVQVQDETR